VYTDGISVAYSIGEVFGSGYGEEQVVEGGSEFWIKVPDPAPDEIVG
jgi:hypothetical protein